MPITFQSTAMYGNASLDGSGTGQNRSSETAARTGLDADDRNASAAYPSSAVFVQSFTQMYIKCVCRTLQWRAGLAG
jgi:hypothetical protein